MKRAALTLLALTTLAACGGGGGGALPPAGGHAMPSNATVTLKMVVPKASGAFAHAGRARRLGASVNPFFVSNSTAGVDVKVYASSDASHAHLLSESTIDVSSGSSACGATTGTPRTCTITASAPAQQDDFVIASYDAPPSNNSFSGAMQLGAAAVSATIAAGTANTLAFTLGGIASTVTLTPSVKTIRGTIASTHSVTVNALDADANVIVSDGYVDANGNPVTIALSLQNGTGPYGGTFALGATSISSPSAAGIALTYDGAATLGPAGQDGTVATTIIATAPTLSSSASATVTTTGPRIKTFSPPTSGSAPYGIALAGDGKLYFTESGVAQIGSIDATGAISEYAVTPGAQPKGITLVSGALWFAQGASTLAELGVFSPSSHTVTATYGLTNHPVDSIVGGSDGQLYYYVPATSELRYMTNTGSNETVAPCTCTGVTALAADASGNIWAGGGTTLTQFPVSDPTMWSSAATPGANFSTITALSNGTAYAGDGGNTAIQYGSSLPMGASIAVAHPPVASALGGDGNVWWLSSDGYIGSVDVNSGSVVNTFRLPASVPTAQQMARGADGNLWFTIPAQNSIGEFIW